MQWVQCRDLPSQRNDGSILTFFVSIEGAVRVSIAQPPDSGILLTREAYYSRPEIETLCGNIHDGLREISKAWRDAEEDVFVDLDKRPLDEVIVKKVYPSLSQEYH